MQANDAIEPLNLAHFQEEFFRRAIRRHVEEYVGHFGERLAALYVSGSVHRNEATPGVSDLDIHSFITDMLLDADQEWWRRAGERMDQEFGVLYGICRPRTVTEAFLRAMEAPSPERYPIVADPADGTLRVQAEGGDRKAVLARMYGILIRYDATLVWGRDLTEGLRIPPPDRTLAQGTFLSPWELVRYAMGATRENKSDFDLPEDPGLRLRYFAKLAVYGGASLLMARGEFRSYRGADVLPTLSSLLPEWAPFMEETRGLYLHPIEGAEARLPDYLDRLASWMEWIGVELGLVPAGPGA